MPRGKKGNSQASSRGKKSTGQTGGSKRGGQNEGVFHEIGRTNKGQERMNEEGY